MKKQIMSFILTLILCSSLCAGIGITAMAADDEHIYDQATGLTYEVSFNVAWIVEYDQRSDTLVIPETLGGYQVTSFTFSENGGANFERWKVKSITLPSGFDQQDWFKIENHILNWDSLEEIHVSPNNSIICSVDGVLYSKDMDWIWRYPNSKQGAAFSIPSSVKSIGGNAFTHNNYLTNITIPDSVSDIGYHAFRMCKSLERITIPNSVTALGSYVFSGSNLKEIAIGTGVTKLMDGLFWNCTELETIRILGNVTHLGDNDVNLISSLGMFTNCENLKAVYFYGDAPTIDTPMTDTFTEVSDKITFYYITGKTGWTSPTWNGIKTAAFIPGNNTYPTSPLTATPTTSTVLVNGENVAFGAYNINGNNYFKLRDLAFALSGSEKQFEVGWDGANNAISLTSGQPYTSVGGEMQGKGAGNKTPTATTSKILLEGKGVALTAYNIDGNNYFKLRDVGEAFNFGVSWDGAKNTIVIDTSKGYTPD